MTPTVPVRELERELRVMGSINPLALEEYEALAERHDFLTEPARRRQGQPAASFNKVIRAIDEEIVRGLRRRLRGRERELRAAVRHAVPRRPGPLAAHRPRRPAQHRHRGRGQALGQERQEAVAALGRRALADRAGLQFAVFRSRPSPFYVIDEVEAALDDVNLHRFLDLIAEFRAGGSAHHREPPEAHDGGGRLRDGVTMQTGGSSKVISEKVAAGA